MCLSDQQYKSKTALNEKQVKQLKLYFTLCQLYIDFKHHIPNCEYTLKSGKSLTKVSHM